MESTLAPILNGGPNVPSDPTLLAVVEQHLQSIIAPLRAELEQIDAAMNEKARELDELRAARRRIAGVLERVSPAPPKPSKNGKAKHATHTQIAAGAEKRQRIRQYVTDHAARLRETGFTGSELERELRDHTVGPPISAELVRRELIAMHDEGLIVLDKLVRGGGKSYKPLMASDV